MTEFDLRSFTKEQIRLADEPDPDTVVDAMVAAIPPRQRGEALRQALTYYVEYQARHLARPRPAPADPKGPCRSRWPEVGDAYTRWLADWVVVAPGVRKFRRNCTADNLRAAASVRRVMAAGNIAAAEDYEKTAAALDEYGASTLGDLPRTVVEGLWS